MEDWRLNSTDAKCWEKAAYLCILKYKLTICSGCSPNTGLLATEAFSSYSTLPRLCSYLSEKCDWPGCDMCPSVFVQFSLPPALVTWWTNCLFLYILNECSFRYLLKLPCLALWVSTVNSPMGASSLPSNWSRYPIQTQVFWSQVLHSS